MFYLLGQFIPFILIALGVGVIVGWLIWGGPDEAPDELEAASVRSDLTQALARLEADEAEITRLTEALNVAGTAEPDARGPSTGIEPARSLGLGSDSMRAEIDRLRSELAAQRAAVSPAHPDAVVGAAAYSSSLGFTDRATAVAWARADLARPQPAASSDR